MKGQTTMTSCGVPLATMTIASEQDVVRARGLARELAAILGFDGQDCTRIATAVSEIARNAFSYAGGGTIRFCCDDLHAPGALTVIVEDTGPGIPHLDRVLGGRYRSQSGMGMGIVGSRRLMDSFDISSDEKGTTVAMRRILPMPQRGRERREEIDRLLERSAPPPTDELHRQNLELMSTLDELHRRQVELSRLNDELEDTNRGVVALYAELDERAERLREADDLKSRFLSNMSHEFRTPLNSILALTRLLLDRTDGELTSEQEKQISYIRRAAQELSEMVNDLLDLAKVESGRIDLTVTSFEVGELFGALRGMLRPLRQNDQVQLQFVASEQLPAISSDEAKVAQILRNLISNALKFTLAGEVRVEAIHDPLRDEVRFIVRDTGIGIPPEHQGAIFEEFAQVPNPLQKRARGTGLGLPLSRRLAELLGGTITLESRPGKGSTFTLHLPARYAPAGSSGREGEGARLLLIDDEEVVRYLVAQQLAGSGFQLVTANGGSEGLELIHARRPDIVLLDLGMPDLDGATVLDRIAADPNLDGVPVVIFTSRIVGDDLRQRLLRRAAAIVDKQCSGPELTALLRATLASNVRTHT